MPSQSKKLATKKQVVPLENAEHNLEFALDTPQLQQNSRSNKLLGAMIMLGLAALFIMGALGLMRYLPILLGVLAPKSTNLSTSSHALARRTTDIFNDRFPLVGEVIVSDTAPLISVLGGVRTALTTNNNHNLALFSQLNANTGFFQIVSAPSNSTNSFRPNNLINYLPSGSLPAIAFNSYDYTTAWIKTSGTVSTVSYGYINQAGAWDYNAVDYAGTASLQSATNVALVASAPLSFTLGIEAPQTITLGLGTSPPYQYNQKRLYIRTFNNNVAAAVERSFTQDSYVLANTGPVGYYFFLYQNQVLIQDPTNIYSIYAFCYDFTKYTFSPPTYTNEIRYTLNPHLPTTINSQGTASVTALNFPPANWVITSNHAINMPNFNNTKAVSFLARSTSAVANSNGDYTFNIYIQLLNNVMGLSGAPITIPIPTSNTLNGAALLDNKPTLVPAPFGCGLFFSGNVTNPQAYFVGVNMTTATPTLMNVVPMFPSTVPQLFGVGVVTDDGNLVTYYLKTTNLESQWASVYRTPGLNIMFAPNAAYTQDETYSLQFALSFPIDTTSTNTVTTLTISIPPNMGTISIANSTLLGTATILNQTPTQITLRTNDDTLLNSIIDMNSNGIIQYTPAQYASNVVPITFTANAGPHSKTTTLNLPGIRVNYPPAVYANIPSTQNGITRLTNTMMGCSVIADNCVLSTNNNQYCEFRRAIDPKAELTSTNYNTNSYMIQPNEIFMPDDITQGIIWFRQTGEPIKPIADLTAKSSAGKSTTVRINVDFTLAKENTPAQKDFTNGQIAGLVFSGVFGIAGIYGTYIKIREHNRKKKERWTLAPLADLSRKQLDLTGVDNFDDRETGAAYKDAINVVTAAFTRKLKANCHETENEKQDDNFFSLTGPEQNLAAQKLTEFFNSDAGKKYVVYKRKHNASLSSPMTYCWNAVSDLCYGVKQLDNDAVKKDAESIASSLYALFEPARNLLNQGDANNEGGIVMQDMQHMEKDRGTLNEKLLKK